MRRWARDLMALASCGGFVWMVWHAALLATAA
jgi:hypothetical protein